MSEGGQINVEIVAKLDQLGSGLNEAVSQIKGACDGIRDALNKTGEGGKQTEDLLGAALKGGIFLEFEEIARQALEGVREAFDMTVGKAEEFGLSNAKFARVIGVTADEAAALANKLDDVGQSTQTYASLALRLGERMGQQEEKFQRLGVATRDASGDLLGGKNAMDAVFAAMDKNPAEQNSIAFAAFGRRALDAFDIMRASKGGMSETLDMMHRLGVQTGDTSGASAELQSSLAELKDMWEALWVGIGQKLMPVVTEFAQWARGEGVPVLQALGAVIGVVVAAVSLAVSGFLEFGTIVEGVLAQLIDVLGHFAIAVYHALTGNWSAIKGDVQETWSDMKDSFSKTMGALKSEADGTAKVLDALFGKPKTLTDKPGVFGTPGKVKGSEKVDAGDEDRKMANERLQTEEKLALARIKAEADADRNLVALGQMTNEEFVAAEVELANRRYEIQLAYLQKKAVADKGNALAHQKDLDDISILEQSHQNELARIQQTGAEKRMQLHKQEAAQFIEDQNDTLRNGMDDLEEEFKDFQITSDEKFARERQLTQQVYGEELSRLDADMATLKAGTAAWNEAYRQRQKVAQEFTNAMKKVNRDAAAEDRKTWTDVTNSIRTSFNSSLNGMILGTMTWQKALGQLIDNVATSFLQMGEKILEDWLMVQARKLIMTETTEAATKATTVSANAAKAASGAYSALAGIPYVGPIIAPIGAAVAYAGTMAFAEKGALLDRDRLVFAHKDEQILPANLSRGMQDIINNGKTGGGDVNLNYSPTVNAPQHKNLGQLLNDDSNTMLAWINARVRDGSLKAR
jgi:hypothetical protein